MTAPVDHVDQLSHAEIDVLVGGAHHDPHSVLGAHPGPDGVTIRALRPLAESVTVVLPDGSRVPMSHLHQGVFTVTVPGTAIPDYRVAVTYQGAPETVSDDPYRHLPTLGEVDLHLIGEGRHETLWTVLGARVRPDAGGTSFAVLGPERPRGPGHRRLQPLGRPRAPDAVPWLVWRVGADGARTRARQHLQVRHLRSGRQLAPQGRPDGRLGRAAAGDRLGRHRDARMSGATGSG